MSRRQQYRAPATWRRKADRAYRRKPRRKVRRWSRAQQKKFSRKIRILVREGYPQRQAVAIAMRMAGVPRKRKHGKRRKQSAASRLRKRRHYYARTVKPRRARLRRHSKLQHKRLLMTNSAYRKWVRDYNDELERRHPGYRYSV